ncbi:hypothetical protein [Vibrio splendidus]|uniref:hypothetical protein n=1 Tax=Vibrio splendidus TaxID=29497 RepID=UPI000D36DEB6|nr:hypothetical protein [Vibrio splendidus]PTP10086.1 hypothetical protein CWN86_00105 [Vibrio splendidus]PTP26517.1 hypothetical protein CWN85_02275 [Vibrio splendidus]PTP68657.1 hypothetical protein CWO31_04570 [Vibrio splendidus]
MKRYPPKSIVAFLFLTILALVLVAAVVLQIRGEQAYDRTTLIIRLRAMLLKHGSFLDLDTRFLV